MNEGNPSHIRQLRGSMDADRFLVFQLGQETYAVPLLKVREVIAPTPVTPVPHTPPHYKGVMNLRGEVISILDLRLKFKMKPNLDPNPETAFIILDLGAMALGVIVDTVHSVVALHSDQISPSPDMESSVNPDFITGIARVENKLIVILDIEKSLNIDELMVLRKQNQMSAAS